MIFPNDVGKTTRSFYISQPNFYSGSLNKQIQIFLFVIFIGSFFGKAMGQSFVVKGRISETFSKSPLAFVHLSINEGEQEMISSIHGEFEVQSHKPINAIKFSLDLHRTVVYEPTLPIEDSIKIEMNRFLPFFLSEKTDSGTYSLVKKIILSRNALKIETEGNFSYQTYNKFTFTYNMKKEMSQSINLALKLLFPRLKSVEGDHHLLLVESATQKDFKDGVHQKETILGSKISGFDDPSLLALSSSIQHFSIYDDFILMGTQKYLGPLHWNAFKRYTFQTVDTIKFKDSTIYVVKFHPKPRTHFDAVKGYLYIHKEKNAVLYVQIQPISHGFFTTDVLQSYTQDNATSKWIPLETRTLLTLEEYGPNKLELVGSGRTYYHSFKPNNTYKNSQFNEYILEYADSATTRDSVFWNSKRKELLTQKDQNTFIFFKKLGNISSAERWIRLGENLFIGKIPIGPITLELNKIINFNNYENVRFGLGFHTNERLSKYFMVGGFLNYGTRDAAYKWGARVSLLLQEGTNLRLNYSISHDLAETGIPVFAFDRFQFSSEPLRKYQVQQYDFNFKNEFSLTSHPFKYLDVKIGTEISQKKPTYPYR
ncbi:MAG: hypothetical protein K2Q22_08385, partial [Cytophagales bacterium]|nr:hypothetical protein [Cytophagales bacterium]